MRYSLHTLFIKWFSKKSVNCSQFFMHFVWLSQIYKKCVINKYALCMFQLSFWFIRFSFSLFHPQTTCQFKSRFASRSKCFRNYTSCAITKFSSWLPSITVRLLLLIKAKTKTQKKLLTLFQNCSNWSKLRYYWKSI